MGGSFAVAWTARPFQGFSNVAPCPNCGERHDICIIDLRLFKLVSGVLEQLETSVNRSKAPPLQFKRITEKKKQKAKELVRYSLFRDLNPIDMVKEHSEESLADIFLSTLAVHALAFAITHETSHMGPGAALGTVAVGPRMASIAGYAHQVGATAEQTMAWADELSTDFNAFNMMHQAAFGAGRHFTQEQRESWDASLLAGATLVLRMIEVVQNAVYPHLPGLSVAKQPSTIRHPPSSLRLFSLWRAFDAGIRLGLYASGAWKGSARNLAIHLEDLFDLRPFRARRRRKVKGGASD